MLGKKIPLTILFCGLLFPCFAMCEWSTYKVKTIINSDKWMLTNGQYLVLEDLKMPDLMFPRKNNQCFVPLLKAFLREEVVNHEILVKGDQFSKRLRNRPKSILGKVKLTKNKLDLKIFFITQGWASYRGSDKKLYQLQDESIKNKKGIWGSCNSFNHLNAQKVSNGDSLFFSTKKQFLAPTSIAWVRDIEDSKILLHNSILVEILGIKDFSVGNKLIDECLMKTKENYLRKILWGKKVFLEKEAMQAKNYKTIYRHVWILGNKYQPPVLVSEDLILKGLALKETSKFTKKYNERFSKAESSLLKEIPTELKVCLETKTEEKVEIKAKFDSKCPIKGNVSGSKKNPKKTYHTPLSGWYKRIEAEKCFADEASAQAAGFTKVK